MIGDRQRDEKSRRLGVLARVGERLSQYGEHVVGRALRDRIIDCPAKGDVRACAEERGELIDQLADSLAKSSRQRLAAEFVDGGANVGDCDVEIVDGVVDLFDDPLQVSLARRFLKVEPNRKDSLDDAIVEIASDAITIVEHTHHANAIIESVVLDGDPAARASASARAMSSSLNSDAPPCR